MIYVLGEALIDMIQVEFSGGAAFVPHTGGSPFNTCIALARLNTPVRFLGRFSSDFFGTMLKEALSGDGVDLSLSQEGSEPTTLGFVKTEHGKDPVYAFYTEGTADSMLEGGLLPHPVPDDAEALVFGSISLLMEPGASVITDYVSKEKGRCVLSFDPNIRPVLIKDEIHFRERCSELFKVSTIVKVSDVDLEWLYPGMDTGEAASEIISSGTSLVVVTMGGDGAFALTGHGRIQVSPVSVEVADTVGAGDTFHAAFLAYLHREGILSVEGIKNMTSVQLKEALAYASLCAAVTCSRPGADPPRLNEVE